MYRYTQTKPQFKPNYRRLTNKYITLYQHTWIQTLLVYIENNKLVLNSSVFTTPRFEVEQWKRYDKRRLPP